MVSCCQPPPPLGAARRPLFWAQDNKPGYVDEWTATRLPWRWNGQASALLAAQSYGWLCASFCSGQWCVYQNVKNQKNVESFVKVSASNLDRWRP